MIIAVWPPGQHDYYNNGDICFLKTEEEPMENKYDETQMEMKSSLPDEEDPPPQTKRRRLKVSASTDTYLIAPLTAG